MFLNGTGSETVLLLLIRWLDDFQCYKFPACFVWKYALWTSVWIVERLQEITKILPVQRFHKVKRSSQARILCDDSLQGITCILCAFCTYINILLISYKSEEHRTILYLCKKKKNNMTSGDVMKVFWSRVGQAWTFRDWFVLVVASFRKLNVTFFGV